MTPFWISRDGDSSIPFAWYWKGKSLRSASALKHMIRPVQVHPRVQKQEKAFSYSPVSGSVASVLSDSSVDHSDTESDSQPSSSIPENCPHCHSCYSRNPGYRWTRYRPTASSSYSTTASSTCRYASPTWRSQHPAMSESSRMERRSKTLPHRSNPGSEYISHDHDHRSRRSHEPIQDDVGSSTLSFRSLSSNNSTEVLRQLEYGSRNDSISSCCHFCDHLADMGSSSLISRSLSGNNHNNYPSRRSSFSPSRNGDSQISDSCTLSPSTDDSLRVPSPKRFQRGAGSYRPTRSSVPSHSDSRIASSQPSSYTGSCRSSRISSGGSSYGPSSYTITSPLSPSRSSTSMTSKKKFHPTTTLSDIRDLPDDKDHTNEKHSTTTTTTTTATTTPDFATADTSPSDSNSEVFSDAVAYQS